MTIALLDGDILAFRSAASCSPTKTRPEQGPEDIAIARLDEWIYRILDHCQAEKYRVFISGSDNFRKQLYPDYKANRRDLPRPEHLDACREFLVREWNAEISAGCEADDSIGIAVTEDSIICSIDKDLRQIPGTHFNFVKNEFAEISRFDGIRNFYSQMLIGDVSDNIRGVDGIGEARARKALLGLNPEEMESCVLDFYGDEQRFILNYRLLRIIRSIQELDEIETTISKGERPQVTELCRF